MRNYLFFLFFAFVSCNNTLQRETKVIPDAAYQASLEKKDKVINKNVLFSERGAYFSAEKSPSYIIIDSIKSRVADEFNISLWFNYNPDDAGMPKAILSVSDTTYLYNKLNLWIAGDRITGEHNSNYLWAKDYDFNNGMSKYYYDLFRLEGGKYYFLSVNLNDNVLDIYINAEIYSRHKFDKDFNINLHLLYLGIKQYKQEKLDGQFYGYIRDITIFDKALSQNEIYSLSVKSHQNVIHFNEEFELSKFDFEKYEK